MEARGGEEQKGSTKKQEPHNPMAAFCPAGSADAAVPSAAAATTTARRVGEAAATASYEAVTTVPKEAAEAVAAIAATAAICKTRAAAKAIVEAEQGWLWSLPRLTSPPKAKMTAPSSRSKTMRRGRDCDSARCSGVPFCS
jgi:hypothetical protein